MASITPTDNDIFNGAREMDMRDKHLNRHMKLRMSLAARLTLTEQHRWASKCVETASRQHRSAFYLMASLWMSSVSQQLSC